MLEIIDMFFVVFHTALIVFNLLGWIWKRTRKANLITLSLTGASWFILGIFYGIGYCPLTDWHFNVLYELGKTDLPHSYTKYLADRLTGMDFNPRLVDAATLLGFIFALAFSIVFNIMDRKKGTRKRRKSPNKKNAAKSPPKQSTNQKSAKKKRYKAKY